MPISVFISGYLSLSGHHGACLWISAHTCIRQALRRDVDGGAVGSLQHCLAPRLLPAPPTNRISVSKPRRCHLFLFSPPPDSPLPPQGQLSSSFPPSIGRRRQKETLNNHLRTGECARETESTHPSLTYTHTHTYTPPPRHRQFGPIRIQACFPRRASRVVVTKTSGEPEPWRIGRPVPVRTRSHRGD